MPSSKLILAEDERTDSTVESSSPEAFLGGVLIIIVLNYAPQRGPREAQRFILAEFSDSEFEGLSASVTYVDIHLI